MIDQAVVDVISDDTKAASHVLHRVVAGLSAVLQMELIAAIREHAGTMEGWLGEEQHLFQTWLEFPRIPNICAAARMAQFDVDAFVQAHPA